MLKDVIVIGAGAAGLCAAIKLKHQNSELSVAIVERLPRVGKKISVTGNGRCNITNRRIALESYHGENTSFAEFALKKYDNKVTEDFFYMLGVPFVFEENKAFPASFQASSVVDALRFAADELGVEILTETRVTDISTLKNGYKISTDKGAFEGKTLLVCSGLYSGGEKLGCGGDVPAILKRLGYSAVKATPAIVQLKTETDVVRRLKGIKISALAKLQNNGKTVREEFGEILFCDYGLSGPPILQISRNASRLEGKITVCLDLFPEIHEDALLDELAKRARILKDRSLEEFFTGMLNKRLGQTVLKLCGFLLSDTAAVLDIKDLKKICILLKHLEFNVTGNTGFINSQVTAGGISTAEFYNKTMMSKKHRGLFLAGEILDIDGDCGGFNLQWAWSSGMCAADGIIHYLKEKK